MKTVIKAAILALILTLAGLCVNWLWYRMTGHLLLAHMMRGGEITAETGFGLSFVHIYAMGPPGAKDSLYLKFDPFSFLLSFAVLFVIIMVVYLIIARLKKN